MSQNTTIRRAIWAGMLDTARVTRYAEVMGNWYRRMHFFIRGALLLSATGSVAAVFEQLIKPWGAVSGLLVAAIVVLDLVLDLGTKIAALKTTKRLCHALEADWKALWRDVESGRFPNQELSKRHELLLQQFHRFTGPMDEHVPISDRANRKSAEYAYRVMEHEHATAT